MTRPLPPPGPDTSHLAARWCAELGEALAEAGRRVGRLSAEIARDWLDDRGREWAERTTRLGHELGREAVAAAELSDGYARQAAEASLPPAVGGVPGRRPGIRLGGAEATRADEERGMRIAELRAEPDAAPG